MMMKINESIMLINLYFQAYESKHLPCLRQENPNMRLSQIKQMLHKYRNYFTTNICIEYGINILSTSIFRDWLKSPENPLNSSLNLK